MDNKEDLIIANEDNAVKGATIEVDPKVDVRVDITNVKNFIFDSGETEYILDINKLLELEILKEIRKG